MTRALGLIRVSKEGGRGGTDRFLSPTIQRDAITGHAETHGHTIVGWREGIDESGSQARSPWWATLDDACGLVEAGDVDVIIVWKLSRTARNRLKWDIAIDRVESAGGRIESVSEPFDTTTSSGRFARGVMVELGVMEAERTGEVWREVHANRLGRGLTHNGRARFGYTYDDGLHVPHPDTGPILADLYRRFTAGESIYALTADLNRRGVTTTTGSVWADGTLRRLLDSGFGAGLIYLEHRPKPGRRRTQPPEHIPGAHTPVITSDEWNAYLSAKRARARVAPRSQRSPYLLSGLVRCWACDGSMTAGTFGVGRTPMYRCETARATAGVGCKGGGYVQAAPVEAAVHAWLAELADDVDAAADRAAAETATARDTTCADRDRLAREVGRLEAALVRLSQQHAEDEGSDDVVFRAARDDYRRRLDEARAAHAALGERVVVLAGSPAAAARPLLDEWDTLGVEGRRNVLRSLIDRVVVEKRNRGTPPGVEVVPLWRADP